jgi:hypothetical protein
MQSTCHDHQERNCNQNAEPKGCTCLISSGSGVEWYKLMMQTLCRLQPLTIQISSKGLSRYSTRTRSCRNTVTSQNQRICGSPRPTTDVAILLQLCYARIFVFLFLILRVSMLTSYTQCDPSLVDFPPVAPPASLRATASHVHLCLQIGSYYHYSCFYYFLSHTIE